MSLPKLLLLGLLVVPLSLLLTLRSPRDRISRSPGFQDIAPEAGLDLKMAFLPREQGEDFKINLYDHGCGLVVADFDADGRDDVFFLNQLGSNGLFRNLGEWQFANATADHSALALEDRVCVGGAFADFDNDGDQDLFVTNTAKWTSEVFVEDGGYYEGPDILWKFVASPVDFESNVLFRNNGDRTFTDVTGEAGLKGKGWSGDVAIFDFDEDGDLDLFVTNMFGLSQLYANNGGGRFLDVTRKTLQRTSYGAIGSKAFDYDNDGRLDLFIADMHSDMWMDADEQWMIEPTKKYAYRFGKKPDYDRQLLDEEQKYGIEYSAVLFGNTLLHNDGDGRFTEVSDAAGMETFWPWGVAVGDFDNDGDEDVYLPSGMGYPSFIILRI